MLGEEHLARPHRSRACAPTSPASAPTRSTARPTSCRTCPCASRWSTARSCSGAEPARRCWGLERDGHRGRRRRHRRACGGARARPGAIRGGESSCSSARTASPRIRRAATRASPTRGSTTRRARSRPGSASRGCASWRLLRGARARLRALRQADRRARPQRAAGARRARSAAARPTASPGLRRLDAAGLRAIEPHAAGIAALHSPQTAIVDFAAVARALADDVRAAGRRDRHGRAVEGRRGASARPAHAPAPRRAGTLTGARAADRPAPLARRGRRGLRRVLRRRVVGPARGAGRRRARSADRPVPRRLPAARARSAASSSAG